MKFLECFLDDPLPPDAAARYDCDGPAVWLDENGEPHLGRYNHTIELPLVALSEDQLEELAARILAEWGDPRNEPEYSARHPYRDGRHNLLLYKLRRKPERLE